jgi:hypothetical protein
MVIKLAEAVEADMEPIEPQEMEPLDLFMCFMKKTMTLYII